MKTFLDSITETCGDKPLYFNDIGKGVSLAALQAGMEIAQELIYACRDHIDDFIKIDCGHGEYRGHFMLLKLGLEQATSIASELFPHSLEGGDA